MKWSPTQSWKIMYYVNIWPLPFRGEGGEKGGEGVRVKLSQVWHQIFQKLNEKTKFFWHV